MAKTFEGHLDAGGLRFGVVVSRFNSFVTTRLLEGALDALVRHGAEREAVDIAWTPGSFEIPLIAAEMAGSGQYDAILCLGAVIRGDTPHFDYVAAESAKGIAQASLESRVPIVYGIVTTDDLEQAIERAGTRMGNKGAEAAVVGIEMANLLKALRQQVA